MKLNERQKAILLERVNGIIEGARRGVARSRRHMKAVSGFEFPPQIWKRDSDTVDRYVRCMGNMEREAEENCVAAAMNLSQALEAKALIERGVYPYFW